MQLSTWPLIRGDANPRQPRLLWLLFAAWLLLIGWLCSNHVLWRDEVRAFSLSLSGSNVLAMLQNVHGEGHPALWYLILRGVHFILPYRQVLPVVGAFFGIAAMAVLTFFSPFRTAVIGMILFSLFGAFEYVVIARNYSIAALTMFTLAALYGRIRDSVWLGVILAILCNTNVPSCLLAGAFLIFRGAELLGEHRAERRRQWQVFAINCALAMIGALICFRTVYPTFNDGAVSANLYDLTPLNVGAALIDGDQAFSNLGLSHWPIFSSMLLTVSCFSLWPHRPALLAALFGFFVLKFFFYFVYVSYYRHEVLFLIFLLSLHWIVAQNSAPKTRMGRVEGTLQFVGICTLLEILAVQSALLSTRIHDRVTGLPYSRSAQLAELLRTSKLNRAIVMGDPDTMLEPIPYYANNPLWFLREQRFGNVVKLTRKARQRLTLDDVLSDAQLLNDKTGRPVVFLSHMPLTAREETRLMMFGDMTSITPASYKRFAASFKLVAHLWPAGGDEAYDVYVFPRSAAD